MEKFTKFLFLSLLFLISFNLKAKTRSITIKADYLIYSEDLQYIFGAGNVFITLNKAKLKGNYLFFDVREFKGKLIGKVSFSNKIFDEIVFSIFPFKYKTINFKQKIKESGENIENIKNSYLKELKKSSIYYEAKALKIYKTKKIIAYNLIPYIVGVPSFPLKKLRVKQAEFFEKSTLYLKNIKYDAFYGLSVNPSLVIRSKPVKGSLDFNFFERKLFNIDGKKRGVNVAAESIFYVKEKDLLNFSAFYNSDSSSYNINLFHENNIGIINYSIRQNISKGLGNKTLSQVEATMSVNKIKFIKPFLKLTYDYKKSYTYMISTPLRLIKNMEILVSYYREKSDNTLKRDTKRYSSSLNFSSSLINLGSSFNLTKDIIEDSIKKDFSLNFSFPQVSLLNNIRFNFSPFYTFSSYPISNRTYRQNNFGINAGFNSSGIILPFGISLYPGFYIYQLWKRDKEAKTNFNYFINFEKRAGIFSFLLNYSLYSSYRTENFWIQGSNLKNMNIRIGLQDSNIYNLFINFYFNNYYSLENISSKFEFNFLSNWRLFSYTTYYKKINKIQTFEIFIEKTFKNLLKIQGGYSLILKRFYLKAIPY